MSDAGNPTDGPPPGGPNPPPAGGADIPPPPGAVPPSAPPPGTVPPGGPNPPPAGGADIPPPPGADPGPPPTTAVPAAGAPPSPPGEYPPPPGWVPPGEPGPESDGGPNKGLLFGGIGVLVIALLAGSWFLFLRGDDGGGDADGTTTTDASAETAAPATTVESETTTTESEPTTSETATTEATTTTETTTTEAETTTTEPADTDTVEGKAVRFGVSVRELTGEERAAFVDEIGTGDDFPVATADTVAELCAAFPVDGQLTVGSVWELDGEQVLEEEPTPTAGAAAGTCVFIDGETFTTGSYQVRFVDAVGAETPVVSFTLGAAETVQTFVNDTAIPLCAVDVGPATTRFYERYLLGDPSDTIDPGETIDLRIADVDHDARGVDCDGDPLDPIAFAPSPSTLRISDGRPDQIPDEVLFGLDGVIASSDQPLDDAVQASLVDLLVNGNQLLPLASTDVSRTLCAAWTAPGSVGGEVVWEFNREVVSRVPAADDDGIVTSCVPPGGDAFPEGSYQAYIERGDAISGVATYTVGREEVQLAFRNDLGVEICEVGFSPALTNWFTYYRFDESGAFGGALPPGEAFTITAPYIENDIQARDCVGDIVSEVFEIPPTDQVVNLSGT